MYMYILSHQMSILQVHIYVVVTLHGDEMMDLRDSGNCSATISLMYSMYDE